jgi:hypothetical protein
MHNSPLLALQSRDHKLQRQASAQVSNPWVKLIFVPQNGGRLMQVVFDDHPFLFVSPAYAGKYVPSSHNEWFN